MKINLEFENAEKFFSELPKFAALIGIANEFASFTYVKKGDSTPVLNPVNVKVYRDADNIVHITSPDEATNDEAHDKIKNALENGTAFIEGQKSSKKTAETVEKPSEETEPDKNTAKEEKPAEKAATAPTEASAKDTDVRAALNVLIKSGKRDAVQTILKEFGAKNFSGLKEKDYAAVIEKAKEAANE